MSSPDTFFAFGAIMVVVALLAIAIDWFGKPIKRKFVPKMYRTPEERRPKTHTVPPTRWSTATFVLPSIPPARPHPERAALPTHAVGPTMPAPEPYALQGAAADLLVEPDEPIHPTLDPQVGGNGTGDGRQVRPAVARTSPYPDEEPRPAPVPSEPAAAAAPVLDPPDVRPSAAPTPPPPPPAQPSRPAAPVAATPVTTPDRGQGWKPGDYIYNLTSRGAEPAAATVRARYWRNVAEADSAQLFGRANLARMTRGKPPRRRNPRTGRIETMSLPVRRFEETDGRTPRPRWPTGEVDPFARR